MPDLILHLAGPSPFVRKVRICADMLALAERIEERSIAVAPGKPNPAYANEVNPLKRVPAMTLADGSTLLDSALICQYLDEQAGGQLIPASGNVRWRMLNALAVANGLTEIAVALRYETFARPEAARWADGIADQRERIAHALDWLEAHIEDVAQDVPDLGGIAIVCAVDYLDFRHADIGWRAGRPRLAALRDRFAERDEFKATVPV